MSRFFEILPGESYPLGATPCKNGVNFAIFSEHASSVELLLFANSSSKNPFKTIKLDPNVNYSSNIWHVFVIGLGAGTFYAYRVDGYCDLAQGKNFNRNKVLFDPYAKGLGYALWQKERAKGPEDNLETSLRSAIVDISNFDWEKDKPLETPLDQTIIYELHVGNFTKSPSSKCQYPGKFQGVIEKIPYLKSLGITAIELMPVHDFSAGDPKNVWGYGTTGFFSPESRYCLSPNDLNAHHNDFRTMVKALHKAGLEVIMDVVFGYTVEAGVDGPTLSFKGLDNTIYYQLKEDDKTIYADLSGCSNTLNCNHPIVAKFITDCLEFWVTEMHVDGFRLDEGSLLARDEHGNILSYPQALWNIELSEVLTKTKLFTEPWDAAGGYLLGKFPGYRIIEWNDQFRDGVRKFINGHFGHVADISERISGSKDLYAPNNKNPLSTLNFITAHDGLTMHDLVTYNSKHNEANGEGNSDGLNHNYSWNHGVEGETDDKMINKIRCQQIQNFFTILLLSKGVPMISMGDEIGRTQNGNSNPYCIDSELTWFDWNLIEKNTELLEYVKKMVSLRKSSFFGANYNANNFRFINRFINDLSAQKLEENYFSCTVNDKLHIIANMEESDLEFELPASKAWSVFSTTGENRPEIKKNKSCINYLKIEAKTIVLFKGR